MKKEKEEAINVLYIKVVELERRQKELEKMVTDEIIKSNRKFLRDRLQRTINHLEDANMFLGEAYEVFSNYSDKYKESLILIGQTIDFAKKNIERLLEHI